MLFIQLFHHMLYHKFDFRVVIILASVHQRVLNHMTHILVNTTDFILHYRVKIFYETQLISISHLSNYIHNYSYEHAAGHILVS